MNKMLSCDIITGLNRTEFLDFIFLNKININKQTNICFVTTFAVVCVTGSRPDTEDME